MKFDVVRVRPGLGLTRGWLSVSCGSSALVFEILCIVCYTFVVIFLRHVEVDV